MQVNQAGKPIEEVVLVGHGIAFKELEDHERDAAIALILQHLKLQLVCTNFTKQGTTELQLQPEE